MIATIHQPLFAPWAGYFHKMGLADLFVILDHVEYTHHNRINRNEIRLKDGRRSWLTVPVRTQGRSRQPIREVEIATRENPRWARKHRETLRQHYGAATNFRRVFPRLEAVYAGTWERVADLDVALIEAMREMLEIETPLVRSSSLGVEGERSEMLAGICATVGADVYLAGTGGSRDYLEPEAFRKRGIEIAYQEFRHPTYAQGALPFEPKLSALDLLFHADDPAAAVAASGGIEEGASLLGEAPRA